MPSTPAPPRPTRLTALDRAALRFAVEQRTVLAAQVALALGCSENAARQRLGRLRRAGWVQRRPLVQDRPSPWQITARGIAAIGSELTVPQPVSLSDHDHEVGVGWLTAAAHAGRFGPLTAIITERTMRARDGRRTRDAANLPATLADGTRGAHLGAHRPDLMVVTASGHRVALELELSAKGSRRLDAILAGYAIDPSIDAVVYFVETAERADALTRSAARVGALDKVRIQRCAWSDGRRPSVPPDRARTARRASSKESDRGGHTPRSRDAPRVPTPAATGMAR